MCGAGWMAFPQNARARRQPENCAGPGFPKWPFWGDRSTTVRIVTSLVAESVRKAN